MVIAFDRGSAKCGAGRKRHGASSGKLVAAKMLGHAAMPSFVFFRFLATMSGRFAKSLGTRECEEQDKPPRQGGGGCLVSLGSIPAP